MHACMHARLASQGRHSPAHVPHPHQAAAAASHQPAGGALEGEGGHPAGIPRQRQPAPVLQLVVSGAPQMHASGPRLASCAEATVDLQSSSSGLRKSGGPGPRPSGCCPAQLPPAGCQQRAGRTCTQLVSAGRPAPGGCGGRARQGRTPAASRATGSQQGSSLSPSWDASIASTPWCCSCRGGGCAVGGFFKPLPGPALLVSTAKQCRFPARSGPTHIERMLNCAERPQRQQARLPCRRQLTAVQGQALD